MHAKKHAKRSSLFLSLPILNISRLKLLYDFCKTLQEPIHRTPPALILALHELNR